MSGHSKWSTIKRKKGAADAKRSKIFSKLIKEITVAVKESGADPDGNPRLRMAIANAKGIKLDNSHVEMIMKVIDALDYNTTASMQRDVMAGRPSELENFNGYIVKMGRELHITTPANSFTYHCLLPQEKKARKAL